jgi:hypothetical protein
MGASIVGGQKTAPRAVETRGAEVGIWERTGNVPAESRGALDSER